MCQEAELNLDRSPVTQRKIKSKIKYTEFLEDGEEEGGFGSSLKHQVIIIIIIICIIVIYKYVCFNI